MAGSFIEVTSCVDIWALQVLRVHLLRHSFKPQYLVPCHM